LLRSWRQALRGVHVPAQATRRLEVNEDPDFQQLDWRIQRAGWVILALIIAAGLAGLLGPGPLSKTTVLGGSGLAVEYERFLRHGAQSELLVNVAGEAQPHGPVRVAISREYLAGLDLQQVTPSPIRVQSAGDAVVYVFENLAGRGSLQAKFAFQPGKLGTHAGVIAVDGGARVSIRQFAYP
jgi:hypothetical protein